MFLYIENYLNISRSDKLDFFVLIGSFKNFKVIHQKVILDNNSLLLEFSSDSDIEFAIKVFEKFFDDIVKKDFEINLRKIKKIVQDKKQLVVDFEDEEQKRIKL
jgi:hypothetical protein